MTPEQTALYTLNVALNLIPILVGLIGLFWILMEIRSNKKYLKK